MKKMLAMALAFTFTFGAVSLPVTEKGIISDNSINANAAISTPKSGDFYYKVLDDDTVKIVDYVGTDEDVTIPETIEGKKVTSLGYGSFKDCSKIKNITIPDSVTNIIDFAFDNCTSLQSVKIPPNVTSISYKSFNNCTSLTDISIPDSVTFIGMDAFCQTPWLEAQQKINPLVVVNGILIDGTTASGDVVLSDKVTSIGEGAFLYCKTIESITIPDSVTSIGQKAFYNADNLSEIKIPGSVKTIEDSTFYSCSNLKSVTISNGVTNIEGEAFCCCNKLENVDIPKSVTYIGSWAFASTLWMDNQQKKSPFVVVNGILIDGTKAVGSVEIPQYINSIGDGAFQYSTKITQVLIQDNIKSIGRGAFNSCSELKEVTILARIPSIEYLTFYKCSSLDSITIPDSVTDIGNGAFDKCESLKEIILPEGVRNIKYSAFYGCSNLTNITIPKSIRTIEEDAFMDCTSLKSLTIPAGATEIEDFAFGFYVGEDHFTKKTEGFTLNCHKDSAAEKYADRFGLNKNVHDLGNWTLTQPATCTEDGEEQRNCYICGETVTRTIKATGHKYTTKVVKPTCTSKGYTLHTCSACGKSYKDTYTKELGHKYVKVKVVKPTLKSKGYTLYKCSKCGATIKKNVVPALVSIGKAKVTGIKNTIYTGKQIKPKITVKVGKTTLKNGRDYTVSYGKNKTVGKGTVTIIGKGKYGGKITKTFKILPAKTSAKLSSTKGKIKVTLKKVKGAKKYQIQYATSKKFKSAKKITTTATKKTLKAKSKKVYYVRVRSVNGKYASGWSAVKKIKVK